MKIEKGDNISFQLLPPAVFILLDSSHLIVKYLHSALDEKGLCKFIYMY